jgi:hypothetical protein
MDDYSFSPASWLAALTNRIMRLRDDVKGALFISLASLALVLFGSAFPQLPFIMLAIFMVLWGASSYLFYRRHKPLFAFLKNEVRYQGELGLLLFAVSFLIIIPVTLIRPSWLAMLVYWAWLNLDMMIAILRSRYREKKARTDANQI